MPVAAHRRRAVRRGALRPLVVRGADVPRGGVPPAARDAAARSSRSRCASTSSATRSCVAGDAEREHVGRGRLRRGLGRARRRRGRGATCTTRRGTRSGSCDKHRGADGRVGRGARPGDPRAPAPAVERLALHPEDGHGDALRRGAHPVARPPAAAPRAPRRDRAHRGRGRRPGSTTCAGATTSSRSMHGDELRAPFET